MSPTPALPAPPSLARPRYPYLTPRERRIRRLVRWLPPHQAEHVRRVLLEDR